MEPAIQWEDVELESENSLSSSPRPLRKHITIKLKSDKGSTSSRGRSRKSKSSKKDDQEPHSTEDEVLDTPIFKTMEPGEPLHHNKKLRWDHKVNLIGEKVVDPLIHCCEKCSLPILIYGRMIQCKHVFCFTCAKKTEKTCPRCGDPVQRIEQSALGTVFLCTYGTSKHGTDGCRRTYLSQRDLNAHIGHRHLKAEIMDQTGKSQGSSSQRSSVPAVAPTKTAAPQSQTSQSTHQALLDQFNAVVRQATAAFPQKPVQDDIYQQGQLARVQQQAMSVSSAHQSMSHLLKHQVTPHTYSATVMQPHPSLSVSQPMATQSVATSSHDNFTSSIPVVGSRISTLISVPIQEDNDFNKQQQSYHGHQSASSMPPVNYPPPTLAQYPVGSMAPNIHQPPPGVPPPMFSSQSVPTRPLQNPVYTAPMTQPLRGPVPQLQGLPRGPQGPSGPPRGPPRMGAPAGPPPSFFEGQNPRGAWTGAPPTAPPRPRGPPQADYNYY